MGRTTYLVINGSGDVQMSLATHHGFIVAPQQLQRVPEVAAGFGLSELVADCPVVSEDERKQSACNISRLVKCTGAKTRGAKKVIHSCRQQLWSRAHHIDTLEAKHNEIKSLSIC